MKDKWFVLLVFLFTLHSSIFAQYTFEKTIGTIDNDEGFTIVQCDDNGYFIVGYASNYYYGYPDPYIIKTNEAGDVIWSDTPGIAEKYDWAIAGIQTFDGGFAVCGYGYYENGKEVFLIKYDADGNLSWQENFQFDSENTPTGLMQTADSGFVFCGNANYSKKNTLSFNYPFVLKTDKLGVQEWFTEIHSDLGRCSVYNIEQSYSGDFMICGQVDLIQSFEKNGWLAKLNAAGNVLWENQIGQDYESESLSSMVQTTDSGFIFSGTKYFCSIPGPGSGDIYLVKTDSLGNVLLENWFDWGFTDSGADVDTMSDGGFIIVGSTQDSTTINKDLIIIRTNELGDSLWTKTFGGEHPDYGYSVCTTLDEGYAICGSTKSYGLGGSDVYLIKTDEYGIMTDLEETELQDIEIRLYPNPCSGTVHFKSDVIIKTVIIFNNLGQLMATYELDEKNVSIEFDRKLYKTGIYFLKISTSQNSITKKIVLQ